MKKIHLQKAKKKLNTFLRNIDPMHAYKINGDRLDFDARMTIPNCDDKIRLLVTVWEDRRAMFDVVFDKMEINPSNLALVNRCNNNEDFLKVYVSETTGYLVLKHAVLCLDENDVVRYAESFFSHLLEADFRPYIEMLCAVTESK